MELANINNWLLFSVLLGLLLVIAIIMVKLSLNFYTKDVIVRKFSLMELEIPSSPKELYNLIKGLYDLPPTQSMKAISSLKGQLRLDYLFMPLAYGSIFLLCWRVANKMQLQFGYYIFMGFAFLQVVPWICDIIENIYLLGKIKPDLKKPDGSESEARKHKRYLIMEVVKWGIFLTAIVCSVSAICYFWLIGNYSSNSFWYLVIILVELIVFLLVVKSILPKKNIVDTGTAST